MTKIRKPFTIQQINAPYDLATFNQDGSFKEFVDWEGNRFASRQAAQYVLDFNLMKDVEIIEILDEISVRIPAKY